jgi:hypothetical protein
MSSGDTLRRLSQRVLNRVLPAREDPEERYHLRRSFYRRYGFGDRKPAGYGNSELAFLRWEIDRGVLNPVDHPARPGSPWWRAVNERILLDAELAAAAHEVHVSQAALPPSARRWMEYLAGPSPASWYRAHNASVMRGYLDHIALALAEPETEQRLIDRVLHRLLFAHALLIPGALEGASGAAPIVDPQGPLVAVVLTSGELYPRTYPAARAAPPRPAPIVELVDDRLIGPLRPAIHTAVAAAVGAPELSARSRLGTVPYPRFARPEEGSPGSTCEMMAAASKDEAREEKRRA